MAKNVKSAAALKSHLAYTSALMSDCCVSIRRMKMSDDDLDWVQSRAAMLVQDLERIIAHAALLKKQSNIDG